MGSGSTYPKSTIQAKVNLGGSGSTTTPIKTTTTKVTTTSKSGLSNASKSVATTKVPTSTGSSATVVNTPIKTPVSNVSVKPTPATNGTAAAYQNAVQQANNSAVSRFNNLKNQVNSIDLGGNLNNNNTGCRATAQVQHITSNLNTQTQSLDLSQKSSTPSNSYGCTVTPINTNQNSGVVNPTYGSYQSNSVKKQIMNGFNEPLTLENEYETRLRGGLYDPNLQNGPKNTPIGDGYFTGLYNGNNVGQNAGVNRPINAIPKTGSGTNVNINQNSGVVNYNTGCHADNYVLKQTVMDGFITPVAREQEWGTRMGDTPIDPEKTISEFHRKQAQQNSGVGNINVGSARGAIPRTGSTPATNINPTQNNAVRNTNYGSSNATPKAGSGANVNINQNSGIRNTNLGSNPYYKNQNTGCTMQFDGDTRVGSTAHSQVIDSNQNSGIRNNNGGCFANRVSNNGCTISNPSINPTQNNGVRNTTPTGSFAQTTSSSGCVSNNTPINPNQNSSIRNSGNTGSFAQDTSNAGCTSVNPSINPVQNNGVRNTTPTGSFAQATSSSGCVSNNTPINPSQNSGVRNSGNTGSFAQGTSNAGCPSVNPSINPVQNNGVRNTPSTGSFAQATSSSGCVSNNTPINPSQNSSIRNSGNTGSFVQGVSNAGCPSVNPSHIPTQNNGLRNDVYGSLAQNTPSTGCPSVNLTQNNGIRDDDKKPKGPEFKPGESGNLEHDDIDYSRINRSEDKVAQGQFMARERVWDDQWGDDGQLRYEVKEDGSILIYEGDVAMGWTDKEGLKALQNKQPVNLTTQNGGIKTIAYGSLANNVTPSTGCPSVNPSVNIVQNAGVKDTNSGCFAQGSYDQNKDSEKDKKPKGPEFKPGESGNLEHDDIDYSRINRSEDKVAQGKFMDRERIWDDQWGDDGQLRYEVKDDGSILIYEGDVAMGWTDKEGLKALQNKQPTNITTQNGGVRTISYGTNAKQELSTDNTNIKPLYYRQNSEVTIDRVTSGGPDGRNVVTLSDGSVKYMTNDEIANYKAPLKDGVYKVNSDVVINRVSDLGSDGRREVSLSNGTSQRLTDEQIYDLNKYGYYGKPVDYIETSVQKNGDPVQPQPGVYTYHYKDGTTQEKFVSGDELENISKMSSFSATTNSGIGVTHDRRYYDPLVFNEKLNEYNKGAGWTAGNVREYKPIKPESLIEKTAKESFNVINESIKSVNNVPNDINIQPEKINAAS